MLTWIKSKKEAANESTHLLKDSKNSQSFCDEKPIAELIKGAQDLLSVMLKFEKLNARLDFNESIETSEMISRSIKISNKHYNEEFFVLVSSIVETFEKIKCLPNPGLVR